MTLSECISRSDRIISGDGTAIPRLSAAMTTPSLNLAASTEVPVTIGLCVCWFGPEAEKCEGSYAP